MDAIHLNDKDQEKFKSIDLRAPDQVTRLKNHIEKKEWQLADTLAGTLIEFEANNPKFLFCLAEIKTEKGDYPSALNTYHDLLDRIEGQDPMYFDVYKNMGNIYLKCGDVEAAEEKYNQAHSINSQDESLSINYGVLYIQKGHYSEAKKRFSEVLTLNNSSDLAWVGMGLVHRAHSDHELARACLLRGLDENPFNKLAISNYYDWCEQDGVEASIEYLNDFLVEFPKDQEMKRLQHGISQ